MRDSIKANMLAVKLCKDSISVTLQSLGKFFKWSCLLLFHAIVPMLVMIVPISLLFAQMGLWYQYRPLRVGEEAMVIMELAGDVNSDLPKVNIESMPAAEVTMGPVLVLSNRQVYWKIRGQEAGYSSIVFQVDKQQVEKGLVIGDGFMRASSKRPGWKWADIMLYPLEKPFRSDSVVTSISIEYPDRLSRTSGTDWWIGYFFVCSMVFAFIFKPFLKVKI